MRLLDAADVQVSEGNWMIGYEATARECDTNVYLADACEEENSNIITGEDNAVYFVAPFGIVAEMFRSTFCYREDDPTWLNAALKDANERALGRAFIMQPTGDSETWLGGMREAPLPTDPENATDADWVAAISNAREMWTSSVVGEAPWMHVAPDHVPKLVQLGILTTDAKGELVSVWGDVVVSSTGYSNPFPLNDPRVVPWLWFTGPVKIRITPVDTSGLILNAQQNHTMIQANEIAAIDFAPCAAVRLGPIDPSLILMTLDVVQTGLTVTVTAPNATGAVTYDWGDNTTDTVAPNGTTPTTHTYAVLGQYVITATDVGGSKGTESTDTNVTFNVSSLGSLKAQLSSNMAPHYCYDFGAAGGQACTTPGSAPQFTYAAPGTYTVSLINSGTGGTPTPGATLKSVELVVTGLKVAGTVTPLNISATSQFSTGAVTYEWGDGTSTTAANGTTPATHTYAEAGDYTVRATDSTGAWGEANFTVPGSAPVSSIETTWWGAGLFVQIYAGGLDMTGGQHTVDWGDGGSLDTFPPFVASLGTSQTYAAPGSYTITVTDSGGNVATIPVVVGSANSPTATSVAPTTAVAGAAVPLTVNGSGFITPKIYATNSGQNNAKDQALVTTPVNAGQATATIPGSLVTGPGTGYVFVENADGSRSGALQITYTAAGAAGTESAPVSEDEFPVDEFPIIAEVEPDETPGPYPLDDEPKPKPPAKKATQGAPIESPAAAKKATPPAAKKAQPPKGESKE